MLIVLSPAKSLDYDSPIPTEDHTRADFIAQAAELIELLRQLAPHEIASLMDISDPLAKLNAERYAAWSSRFTRSNSRQAVFAFDGDVYDGLAAREMTPRQLEWVQEHVRILSGLYGVLRPLDRLQPYRLEMGTRLANPKGRDLYAFWGEEVTRKLVAQIEATRASALVNLASEEYFKVVKPKLLPVPVITPVFEDWKGGRYKIISFFAKRARGMMARYAAGKNLNKPDKLKDFDVDGYAYDEAASSEFSWVFRRRQD